MTYDATVLARSPVFYMPMTETSGTVDTDVFADAGGNGHLGYMQDGIIPGGADGFLSGEKAAAVDTTTGSGVIKPEDALGYASMPSLTMEVWMQVLSPSLADGVEYLDYWIKDADTGNTILFRIQGWATGQIELMLAAPIAGSSTTDEIVDAIPLAHSACWHHYVASFDSVSGDITFYIDGVAVGSINDPATIGQHVTAPHAAEVAAEFNAVINLNHVALYAVALTATQIAENYAAATPRQDAACFVDWVRLSHVSGQGYWQSKGDVTEEWAGGTRRLRLPLSMLSATPATLVGQDPATLLPAYCPAPMPSTTTVILGGDGGRPAPPTTCVQMRCGVSLACANHLDSLYEQWSDWLDPLVAGITDFALIVLVIDPFFDALIAGMELASDIAIAKGIQIILKTGVGAITGNLFDQLSPDEIAELQKPLFCQLACSGDVVTIVAHDITVWHDAVANETGFPGLSRDLLTLLLQFTPLANWQAIASQAGTSTACDMWTCP